MKIIANGIHKVAQKSASAAVGTSVVLTSGTMGGATVTLGYYDEGSNFIPFTDGGLDTGEQLLVNHGFNVNMFVEVTGATVSVTEIFITCAGIH